MHLFLSFRKGEEFESGIESLSPRRFIILEQKKHLFFSPFRKTVSVAVNFKRSESDARFLLLSPIIWVMLVVQDEAFFSK